MSILGISEEETYKVSAKDGEIGQKVTGSALICIYRDFWG